MFDMTNHVRIVKTQFNFGWQEWRTPPIYAKLALRYQKGDILDVGCGTCQLYRFLRKNGWEGKYYGVDIKRYDYTYPKDIELIIGDALEIE
ncbi:class I SAM-dependent methyltransferase, partial [Thermococcus sp.]